MEPWLVQDDSICFRTFLPFLLLDAFACKAFANDVFVPHTSPYWQLSSVHAQHVCDRDALHYSKLSDDRSAFIKHNILISGICPARPQSPQDDPPTPPKAPKTTHPRPMDFQRTAELPLFPQRPKFAAQVQRHEEGRRANSEDTKGAREIEEVATRWLRKCLPSFKKLL